MVGPDYTAMSCPTATVWEFVQKNKKKVVAKKYTKNADVTFFIFSPAILLSNNIASNIAEYLATLSAILLNNQQ